MEKSLLTTLAPEIRNRIWELVVAEEDPIILAVRRTECGKAAKEKLQRRSERPQGIDLLQTCRQINLEATQMFYASKHFIISKPDMDPILDLDTFLFRIGMRNTAALQSVTIELIDAHNRKSSGTMVCALYEPLKALRRRARGFTWTKAKVLVYSALELQTVELDALDFGEPWDRASFEVGSLLLLPNCTVRPAVHLTSLRDSIQTCREMMREIEKKERNAHVVLVV